MAEAGGEGEPEVRARKVSTFTKAAFRNSVFDEACIIEGYLKKYSHGVFRRWQDRYFTIQGHYLKYYTDSNKIRKDLKGTIDLDGVKSALLTGKTKGEFRVMLKEGEAIMKAETDEEAQKWAEIIAAMEGALKANGVGAARGLVLRVRSLQK